MISGPSGPLVRPPIRRDLSGMGETASRLRSAFARIDAVNAEDPRTRAHDGSEVPQELLYARRMSATLDRFEPGASDALRLAVRAQHVARWRIPRGEYPGGKAGYKAWRTRLMGLHAEIADGILREVGYDEAIRERVGRLLRKQGIKRDSEVQTLEDVACLVFLEYYFDEFAAKHEDEKLVEILEKTLVKMSDRGRAAALTIDMGERARSLIARAVA